MSVTTTESDTEQRIALLEHENEELRGRVERLETVLRGFAGAAAVIGSRP